MQFLHGEHQVLSKYLMLAMKTSKRSRPRLHCPSMAPFASLIFVVNCFFLLTTSLETLPKGIVRLEETPYVPCSGCLYVSDHTQIYVGLTDKGRLSFAVSDPNTQRAIVQEVLTNREGAPKYALTEAQLLDCVISSRRLSRKFTNMPAGVYLAINAQTKASKAMRLMQQFQQRGIIRLYLLTHCAG